MSVVYAMGIGFCLDCLLGDPHSLPHPVRWIGSLIGILDKALHRRRKNTRVMQILCGAVLVLAVLAATGLAVSVIRCAAYRLHAVVGTAVDGILFYYCIAPRSLRRESMAVYEALAGDGAGKSALAEARRRLSMIVGRDTAALTEEGIVKAAVETVAENATDGVAAPMLYMALGGPLLSFLYKAVNTMDSMVGYHSEDYEYFGKAAAKTDDIWNYIPSRLTALVMIAASYLLQKLFELSEKRNNSNNISREKCANNSNNLSGCSSNLPKISWRCGLYIYKRDRRKHKSPNSAQTESVCAGALGIRLAGDASYFGTVVHKPYIGDAVRAAEREDIRRANRLMYVTAALMMLLAAALRIALYAAGVAD